ncbi:ATP-dependent 6-phosphofructokinase [Trifolium repens]|nr:ATP-dependent 6-phosphofructokinase [Trifolium repens]
MVVGLWRHDPSGGYTVRGVSRTNARGRTLLRIRQEKQQCEHERLHNSIQDRGINKVYIIGGDGTQRAASVNFLII